MITHLFKSSDDNKIFKTEIDSKIIIIIIIIKNTIQLWNLDPNTKFKTFNLDLLKVNLTSIKVYNNFIFKYKKKTHLNNKFDC